MARKLIANVVSPNTLTDLTGGGLAATDEGTWMLNLVNDTGGPADLSAVYITAGENPAERHKINPAQTLEARSYLAFYPLLLGSGFKVFVQSDVQVSAQLFGETV